MNVTTTISTHGARWAPRIVLASLSLALPWAGGRGASGAPPEAPTAGAKADAYKESSGKNAAQLRQFSWDMRVALTVKGEAKAPQVYQMRFDRDGTLQKTLMTAPAPEKKQRGIVRGKIAEGKKEEFKEFIAELGDVVKDYTAPSAGTMMDFFSKAKYVALPDGTTRASSTGFLKSGDSVEFQVDTATGQPGKYGFMTKAGGDPVTGVVEYDRVKDGPLYAARVSLSVPAKEMTAVVETFNYMRQ
jgi:hypothetical protein